MSALSITSRSHIIGLAALLASTAHPAAAQTIYVSSIYANATSLAATLSTSKTYTHTLVNWGSYNTGYTSANGVAFARVSSFDAGASASGTSLQGNPFTVTAPDGYAGATGGGMGFIFNGFMMTDGYNPDASANQAHAFTLGGLTAGQAYEMRFYAGSWGDTAGLRTFDIAFTDGTTTKTLLNYDESGGYTQGTGHHFLGITYTPADSDVTVTITQKGGTGYDYHFFALSNEVSAVPEPSTCAALAGMAMLALAVWRRRKTAT